MMKKIKTTIGSFSQPICNVNHSSMVLFNKPLHAFVTTIQLFSMCSCVCIYLTSTYGLGHLSWVHAYHDHFTKSAREGWCSRSSADEIVYFLISHLGLLTNADTSCYTWTPFGTDWYTGWLMSKSHSHLMSLSTTWSPLPLDCTNEWPASVLRYKSTSTPSCTIGFWMVNT